MEELQNLQFHYKKLETFIHEICLNIVNFKDDRYSNNFNEIITLIYQHGLRLQKEILRNTNIKELLTECKFFLSHLKNITHYSELMLGPSENTKKAKTLISDAELILWPKAELERPNDTHFIGKANEHSLPSPSAEDDQRPEKSLSEEQQKFNANKGSKDPKEKAFRLFLEEMWKYAITHKIPSIEIFFSYGWPTPAIMDETWTQPFIENFATDLISSGICVVVDQKHSGPGCELNPFMQKIFTSDQVFIFDSKTRDYKLALPRSGVRYENELINQALNAKQDSSDKYFAVHIQLSRSSEHQNNTVSFLVNAPMTTDYLELLRWVILQAYSFKSEPFQKYWEECLFKYKILEALYNVRPMDSNTIKRQNHLSDLKSKLNLEINKIIICHGEENTGKTQLALNYVWENYYYYNAVYWINMDDPQTQNIGIFKNDHLLIIDNAKSLDDIKPFLKIKYKKMIVLSRDSEWPQEYAKILIGELSEAESQELIIKILGEKKGLYEQQLIKTVGRMPYALSLACGYIQRNKISITDYIDQYNHSNGLSQFRLMPIRQREKIELTISDSFKEPDFSMDFISTNITINEIKAHLFNLYVELEQSLNDSLFKETSDIINTLIESKEFSHLLKAHSEDINKWTACLTIILSHIEMIIHHLKFSQNISFFPEAKLTYTPELNRLIIEGYKILNQHIKLSPKIILAEKSAPLQEPAIANPDRDDPKKELINFEAQQEFDQNNNIKFLLNEIWKFTIINNREIKIIFISFAFPEKNSEDAWTEIFMNTFVKHLINAGIKVFFDKNNTGQDFKLKEFIKLHPEQMNNIHVLVIGTRSRDRSKDRSNKIKEEDHQILELLDKDSSLNQFGRRFVIPIQLTSKKHYHKDYHRFASHSFYEKTYYQSFGELIPFLCNFGDEFRKDWKKKLLQYKVTNNFWHVPAKNKNFVGRQSLLKNMQEYYWGSKDLLVLSALHGIGGVGKTHLAIQFAYQYGHEYSEVFWVSGDSQERLIQSYIELGEEKDIFNLEDKKLNPEARAKIVINWIEQQPSGWLVIIDNAPNHDEIKNLFPSKGGKILITSRHTEWAGNDIQVSVFTPEEAFEYIKKIIGEADFEFKSANELIILLGHLPLAIAQACAYIKNTEISLSEYVDLYQQKREELQTTNLLTGTESHNAVSVTWNITLERMQKELPESVELLYLCVHLYNENIPKDLTKYFFDSPVNATNTLRIAGEYSMVRIDEEKNCFSLHSLVQEIIKIQLQRKMKHLEYLKKSIDSVLQIYPYNENQNTHIRIKRQLLHHLEILLKNFDEYIKTLNLGTINQLERILMYLSDVYNVLGNAQKRKDFLERALPIFEYHYSKDHPKIAVVLVNLGNAYGDLGNGQQRKELLERALIIDEKNYGKEHVAVAMTLTNLGNAYGDLGDAKKQKDFLERALIIDGKCHGIDHPTFATTLVNLGIAYGDLGDTQKKKELLEQALPILEKHYGKDHLTFATTLVNLGNAYGGLGNPQEQKLLLEKALTITKKHYVKDHINIVAILFNLSNAYGNLGNMQKKNKLLEKILPLIEKYYGENHYKVAMTQYNLATTIFNLKNINKAYKYCLRAYQILVQHPDRGITHPETKKIENFLFQLKSQLLEISNDEEGEELQKTTTLSLQDQTISSKAETKRVGSNRFGMFASPSTFQDNDTEESDDEELQKAIELSLQDQIDSSHLEENNENSDDEELQRALALSRGTPGAKH
jgi:tetratricopeptide (TPR) repeat protein